MSERLAVVAVLVSSYNNDNSMVIFIECISAPWPIYFIYFNEVHSLSCVGQPALTLFLVLVHWN